MAQVGEISFDVRADTDGLDGSIRKVERATDKMGNSINRFNTRMTKTAKGVNKSFRAMRGGVSQLGYQVQDVAVQLQSGQNALLVLGQQGSQVASIFGPGGAVIGAFLAVAAAITTALIPSLDEAEKKLDELPKDLAERLNAIKEQLQETDEASIGTAIAVEVQKINNEYDEMQKRLMRLRDAEKFLQEQVDSGNVSRRQQLGQTQRTIAELEKNLTDLGRLQEKVVQAGLDEQLQGAKGVNEEADKRIELEQKLAQQLAISEAKLNGGTVQAMKLAAAFQLGLTNAEQLPEEVVKIIEAIASADEKLEALRNKQKEQTQFKDPFADVESLGGQGDDFLSDAQMMQLEQLRVRNEKLQELEDEAVKITEEARDKRIASYAGIASGIAGLTGQIASVLKESEGEQSSAYKAMFAVSKAFAIAQASMNLALAISQALADPTALTLPQKLANYAAIASSGAALVSQISGASFGGGRYNGGPVDAGSMYEVGERNKPELLMQGNRQYLIPGNNGQVVSNRDMMGGSANIEVNVKNYSGGQVDVQRGRSQDGRETIDIVVGDIRRRGKIHKALTETTTANNRTRGS